LVLEGSEWSLLYLWERAPGTHWIEGGVDPRVGLDTAVEKILATFVIQTLVIQPIACHYTDFRGAGSFFRSQQLFSHSTPRILSNSWHIPLYRGIQSQKHFTYKGVVETPRRYCRAII
jgi:hypothetical protein